jgi:hypothetical protein
LATCTMTEKLEWDFPPSRRWHRRPRVEVLEPPENIHAKFDVIVRHQHRPSPWAIAAIVIALLVLWRHGAAIMIAALMFSVLVGRDAIEASIFVGAILAVLAWRERRAGRAF